MPGTPDSACFACSSVLRIALEVGAEDLQHDLAAHAGHRLLDVVLDRLREVELHARDLLERRAHLVDQPILGRARSRHCSRGLRCTNVSLMLMPSSSVPSSGRPCSDSVATTSGNASSRAPDVGRISRLALLRDARAASRRRSRGRPRRAPAGTPCRARAAATPAADERACSREQRRRDALLVDEPAEQPAVAAPQPARSTAGSLVAASRGPQHDRAQRGHQRQREHERAEQRERVGRARAGGRSGPRRARA